MADQQSFRKEYTKNMSKKENNFCFLIFAPLLPFFLTISTVLIKANIKKRSVAQGESLRSSQTGGQKENERTKNLTEASEVQSESQEDSSDEVKVDEQSTASREDVKTIPRLMSRCKITFWKAGARRAKEWRQNQFIKSATKRQRDTPGYPLRKRHLKTSRYIDSIARSQKGEECLFTPAPFAIAQIFRSSNTPKIPRRKLFVTTSNSPIHRSHNLKQRPKYDLLTDISVIEAIQPHRKTFSTLPLAEFEASYRGIQLQIFQDNPTNCNSFDDETSPITMYYPGEVLLCPCRLLSHLRSEPHHEVYAVASLTTNFLFEAKVYTLRGIHPNQRKRHINNLKSMAGSKPFLTSFDWNGKKYCLFKPGGERSPGVEANAKLCAIGRRNTKTYNDAFLHFQMNNYCVFELGGEERLGLEGNTKLGTVGTRDMKEYRDVLLPLNAPRPLKNVDRNSKRDNTLKWVEKESGVVLPEDSKSPLSQVAPSTSSKQPITHIYILLVAPRPEAREMKCNLPSLNFFEFGWWPVQRDIKHIFLVFAQKPIGGPHKKISALLAALGQIAVTVWQERENHRKYMNEQQTVISR
ncbi:hypothetical protein B0J14DRAFT_563834 [Halenospora varia]|nr:hypothetical protein B0J14DRAFT_563834 [Halenospora varia]